jgi:hypothetical protein
MIAIASIFRLLPLKNLSFSGIKEVDACDGILYKSSCSDYGYRALPDVF